MTTTTNKGEDDEDSHLVFLILALLALLFEQFTVGLLSVIIQIYLAPKQFAKKCFELAADVATMQVQNSKITPTSRSSSNRWMSAERREIGPHSESRQKGRGTSAGKERWDRTQNPERKGEGRDRT
jgi:hypothetical protein